MNQIGLAIIGAGAVVQGRHLPALATLPEAAVRTVYDPDQAAAGAVAQATGARVAASLADAVADSSVQAVLIASPNALHREAVEGAAAAGRHVLCEKPIATTLADARAMIDAAARAGVVLQIGFHHRFTSEFRLVRRLLEADVIGRLHAFQASISEQLSVLPPGANYRLDPHLGGGLTLIDVGSHRLDQLRALVGDFDEVAAQFANVNPSHGLDDNVALLVKTTAGALGTIAFERFSHGALSPTTLVGERGVLCFNAYVTNPFHAAPVAVYTESPLPEDVRAYTRPADWWNPPATGWTALWPPIENPYAAELRAFFDAIRDHGPPAVTGDDGYRCLEIVLAACKAWRDGRTVRLPLDPQGEILVPTFSLP
jgi:predicted dehydrogenase